jgi:hypothetical protein
MRGAREKDFQTFFGGNLYAPRTGIYCKNVADRALSDNAAQALTAPTEPRATDFDEYEL